MGLRFLRHASIATVGGMVHMDVFAREDGLFNVCAERLDPHTPCQTAQFVGVATERDGEELAVEWAVNGFKSLCPVVAKEGWDG